VMGGFVPRTTLFLVGGSVCPDRWLFQLVALMVVIGHGCSDVSDWRCGHLFSIRLILLQRTFESFVVIRIVVVCVCSCRLVCAGGCVAVLSDSVLVVFAWFGDRLPLGSLRVCFSFAGLSYAFGFWWSQWWLLVLDGSMVVFVGGWFSSSSSYFLLFGPL